VRRRALRFGQRVRFALGTPGEVESPIFVASHLGDFIRLSPLFASA
jgi:hypothetical protein